MRIVWLTDIHLNFCTSGEDRALWGEVEAAAPDAVLISGDIAESEDAAFYLERMERRWERPIYFVLGNHDYYFGSIAAVRQQMDELCASRRRLVYLSHRDVCELTPRVGLVGHDGWADGRCGDYANSDVMLSDYRLIAELARYSKRDRLPHLRDLGDEAGHHIRRVLPKALAKYPHVFLVTHVPPLHEACWHEGRLSDDEWAPHFTCRAVGDAILDVMAEHPDRQLTVLCGHTHGEGECRPLPNVLILTGAAEYNRPRITRIFDLDRANDAAAAH